SLSEVLRAASAPIHECLAPDRLFEDGMGNVTISRKLPSGLLGISFFLLDIYCLGVKDAFFRTLSELEYRAYLRNNPPGGFENMSPACMGKLVEDAEDYARDLGFSPHPDYQLAKKIFGDIDKSQCAAVFEFGKDGKPFFFAGPNDTPAKSRKIIETLANRCGPDGFHYIAQIGGSFIGDFDDEDDDLDLDEI